jgi:hypothetical protein
LARKTKTSASGWISRNAVCCQHNGHKLDTRGRGGILPTEEGGVSHHCFNCGFTASWQPGRRINLKMRRLLSWLNVSEDDIRRLSLFALSNLDSDLDLRKEEIKELPKFEAKDPCPGKSIAEWRQNKLDITDSNQLEEVYNYIKARGLVNRLEQLYWAPQDELRNRILVPFSFLGQPMGYSGRLIREGRPKYYSDYPSDMIYGYDNQLPNSKFCIVVEGLIDAVAIDGIAILSNDCNETKALIIDSLNRDVIVVPDRDKAGLTLIKQAMEYGWSVSFPDWHPDIKDVADAVKRYGQLFTMKSILCQVETSNLKIKLRSRKWINQ